MEYIVRPNDTLFLIARRFGLSLNQLLVANPQISDPNLLFVGQRIRVPIISPVAPSGCLIFISTCTGRPEVWRSDPLGNKQVQLTNPKTTNLSISNPQWSPNGRLIAFLAGQQLLVTDSSGRNPTLLAANVRYYSWSNDSTRIAYSTEAAEPLQNSTFITDLAGNTRLVATNFNNPVWFPGDRQLAGFKQEEGTYPRLVTIDLKGTNLRMFDVPTAIVKLAPNGRYAATQLLSGSASGVISKVWVYDFITNQKIQLPGYIFKDTSGRTFDYSILGGWSPDSARLIYSTLTAVNGRGELRIALPQGSILQVIPSQYYPEAIWGPTTDWIAYTVSQQPGQSVFPPTVPRNIFLRSLTTKQKVMLTRIGDNYQPNWGSIPCPT